MVSNEKVKLMTQIALYDKKEKKKLLENNHYYRGDFICVYLLRAFLLFTIAYFLCLGMWILYNGDNLLAQTDITVLIQKVRVMVMVYLVGLLPFFSTAYLVYWLRYTRIKKEVKDYQKNLKRLRKWYRIENERHQGIFKESSDERGVFDDDKDF